MAEMSVGITDANGVTTGTSRRNLLESAVAATILVAVTIDLEDFGWWSREVLTGFPELRRKIRRGWDTHKSEYL
jgi:hypothetical protein